MTQNVSSKDLQDEIVMRPTVQVSNPRRVMASLVSINIKTAKSTLSQALTDRYPTGTSNDHIITGTNTARHQASTNSSMSSTQAELSPARPTDVLYSSNLPKKVRVKALLPKFETKTSMQKDEESEIPQRTQKRALTDFPVNQKREKFFQHYDDYSISELRATYNVKNDSKLDSSGLSSPKLPSIPRKTSGDESPGGDNIKIHKTLLTQSNHVEGKPKESSLSPYRIPVGGEKETNDLKISRNPSSDPMQKGSAKKVGSESKTPRMFFGVGSTRRLFDNSRGNMRKEAHRAPVAPVYGGQIRAIKVNKIKDQDSERKEIRIPLQEAKTDRETTKKGVAMNQEETSSKHNSSPEISPKHHRSQSHFVESGSNSPNRNHNGLSKPMFDIEKARLSIEELGELEEQVGLKKTPSSPKASALQYPPGSPTSPRKNATFKRAVSEVGALPSPNNQATALTSHPSLKKIIPKGYVIKPSGFGSGASFKRNRTLTEDLTEGYEETVPNSPAGPTDEINNKLNIFKESNGVNFFELNEEHFLLGGDFARSSRRTKTYPAPPFVRENDAIIVTYSGDKDGLTIRPKYMEDYGTMCFTELWSAKSKTTYKHTKNEVGMARKVHFGPEDPLHRPGQVRKKSLYESMVKANQKELSTPTLKNYEAQLMSAVLQREAHQQEAMSKLRGVVDRVMRNNSDKLVRTSTPKKMSYMPSH